MKTLIMTLGVFFSNLMLNAGGNENLNVSSVAEVSEPNCKHNKVYTEKDVHLMWQDQAYTDAEDGAYKREHSLEKSGSWNHAMNYCSSLDYQGYSDWRLPTSDELQHVHHKEGQLFTYYRDGDFWTSTPTVENKYYVVSPVDAYRYKRTKNQSNYIRCVRCKSEEKKPSLYRIIRDEVEEVISPAEPVSVDTFE
jgi:hypothetical protein